MKNTYTQDKNFKNKVFSKGEDLTDADIEIIKSRTKRSYVKDTNYESYYSIDFSSVIYQTNSNEYTE